MTDEQSGNIPMSENFQIVDHCFEHPKYNPNICDADRLFADKCSYNQCNRPEIEHLWTVEAGTDNDYSINND